MDDTQAVRLTDVVQTASNGYGRLNDVPVSMIDWHFKDSRYSCYLSVQDNNGQPFPLDLFCRVIQPVLEFSGGATYNQVVTCSAPRTGLWVNPENSQLYQEPVVVIDVTVPASPEADRFFKQWKARTAQLLNQLEVLVVRQPALVLTLETLQHNRYQLAFEDWLKTNPPM